MIQMILSGEFLHQDSDVHTRARTHTHPHTLFFYCDYIYDQLEKHLLCLKYKIVWIEIPNDMATKLRSALPPTGQYEIEQVLVVNLCTTDSQHAQNIPIHPFENMEYK